MKKNIILLLGLIALSGCAKVSHLDQLLTLKSLADEQVQISQYITEQDQKFELMLQEVEAGTLDQYSNKAKILRTFGDPVYVKNITQGDQKLEAWLYRYATEFFDSQKVYLYFDSDENLLKSECIKESDGKIR